MFTVRMDRCIARRFKLETPAVNKHSLQNHGGEPRKIVTDKLRSYGGAHRELDGGAQP